MPSSSPTDKPIATAPVKGRLPDHLSATQCQRARQSRDARFDGQFVVAVKTTGIFCRPICPVVTPKEKNVEYFGHGAQAMEAGYRPCLRCRPDSAPDSWAWRGTETTFIRALKNIEAGALQHESLTELSDRLGVTDRYVRKLFEQYLGTSPKQFDVYKRLMFAKQLLHDSQLSISDVAYAAGFNSVRRFNDAFQKKLSLTPTQVRKQNKTPSQTISLNLAFRPPFDWMALLDFYRARQIQGLEYVGDHHYERLFKINKSRGWFSATMNPDKTSLAVQVEIDDVSQLQNLVNELRRFFDLDADLWVVESHLKPLFPQLKSGVRLPGIWDVFEAGVRAVLGQQVSITAAKKLVQQCVDELGESVLRNNDDAESTAKPFKFFPAPEAFVQSDLAFLKIPHRRRETLKALAQACVEDNKLGRIPKVEDWIHIPGIGSWTVNYVRMRGLSDPDVFLNTDLGVKHGLQKLEERHAFFEQENVSPWGSYATFQLWMLT